MNEIERLLSDQEVAKGHPDFDARMNRLFQTTPRGRPAIMRRRVALWQAVAVSFLMGGLGYWMGSPQVTMVPASPPSEYVTTMYIIETQSGSVRNAFDVPPDIEPFFRPPAPPVSMVVPASNENEDADRLFL